MSYERLKEWRQNYPVFETSVTLKKIYAEESIWSQNVFMLIHYCENCLRYLEDLRRWHNLVQRPQKPLSNQFHTTFKKFFRITPGDDVYTGHPGHQVPGRPSPMTSSYSATPKILYIIARAHYLLMLFTQLLISFMWSRSRSRAKIQGVFHPLL